MALIVSNLAWLAIAVALFALGALLSLLVAWVVAGMPHEITPVAAGLRSSSLFILVTGAIATISASMIAGHIAGRIAKSGQTLNGALSCSAWLAILIYFLLGGSQASEPPQPGRPPMPELIWVVLFPGAPVIGAFGGWTARHFGRRRNMNANESQARTGRTAGFT